MPPTPDGPQDEARQGAPQIADSLIAEIRGGALASGSPLPSERALAERFGASRPTVREALAHMQHRGFLEAGGGRRPRALKPSLDSALESASGQIREALGDAEVGAQVEQLRLFVETGAAREAALKAGPLHIARIREALDRNLAEIGRPGFAASDIAFHRAVVAVVENPILLRLHDMFVTSMLANRPDIPDRAASDRTAYGEHREIYGAIVERDLVTATEVIERHLARSYRARLREHPPGPP